MAGLEMALSGKSDLVMCCTIELTSANALPKTEGGCQPASENWPLRRLNVKARDSLEKASDPNHALACSGPVRQSIGRETLKRSEMLTSQQPTSRGGYVKASSTSSSIRVAIVGLGNCASSLADEKPLTAFGMTLPE